MIFSSQIQILKFTVGHIEVTMYFSEIKLKKFKRYFQKILQVQILQPQLFTELLNMFFCCFKFYASFQLRLRIDESYLSSFCYRSVEAGDASVLWALDVNNRLYLRREITSVFPEGTAW